MNKEQVIELMKNKRVILGVDFTGIEHLSKTSKHQVKCMLYWDTGTFVPKLMDEIVLTEKEISEVLANFKELWTADDINRGSTISYVSVRYYAVNEPNQIFWVNSRRLSEKE